MNYNRVNLTGSISQISPERYLSEMIKWAKSNSPILSKTDLSVERQGFKSCHVAPQRRTRAEKG